MSSTRLPVAWQDLHPGSWPPADIGVRRIITGFRSHGPVALRPVTPEQPPFGHAHDATRTPQLLSGIRAFGHGDPHPANRGFPYTRSVSGAGFWGGFLGFARISDLGGPARASPDPKHRLRVARSLAPESPPGTNPETSPRNVPGKGPPARFEQQSNRSARLARPLHTAVSRAIMCLSAVLTRGRGIACRDSLGDESSATRSGRSE
jgi:hypothetical protein